MVKHGALTAKHSCIPLKVAFTSPLDASLLTSKPRPQFPCPTPRSPSTPDLRNNTSKSPALMREAQSIGGMLIAERDPHA